MSTIHLKKPDENDLEAIEEYYQSFVSDERNITHIRGRIPGLSYYEQYEEARDWFSFAENMDEKISWYMALNKEDRIVGFGTLRHQLEYDDDEIDFASHIGYSVRPDERGKGYAKQILGLLCKEASTLGIHTVRLVCRDTNIASIHTILACGGRYIDTIHGEESGANVERYDIDTQQSGKETELHLC